MVKSAANVNIAVTVNLQDLLKWHQIVVDDKIRKLEEAVISDKAETYPSKKQTAEIFGVNLSTLWLWEKKGYLLPIEVGGKRRYRMSDIKHILEGKSK